MNTEQLSTHGIHLGQLFCDKFTGVMDIPDTFREGVKSNVRELVKEGRLKKHTVNRDRRDPYSGHIYKQSYNYEFKTGERVLVQIDPIKNREDIENGYLRVEFNPNKLTEKQWGITHKLLNRVLGKDYFCNVFHSMRVTRIDFATDIEDFSLCDALLHSSRARTSEIIEYTDNGGITHVSGSTTTKHYVKTYEKRHQVVYTLKEMAKKDHSVCNIQAEDIHPLPITRVETVHKRLPSLSSLYTMTNPLSKIQFYRSNLSKDDFDEMFIELAKTKGLTVARSDALKQKAKDKKVEYKKVDYIKVLEKYRIYPFDSEALWSQRDQTLRFLKIFDSDFEEIDHSLHNYAPTLPLSPKRKRRSVSVKQTRGMSRTAHPS